MIKVKFLRDFYSNGNKHTKGQILEVTQSQSDELLKRGVVTLDVENKTAKKQATKETKEK
jgi:hypothetical protein